MVTILSVCFGEQAKQKQDQLHKITLQRLAVRLQEGLKKKYVIGSDEFGMHLFPRSQWKWEKKGSAEVKSVLKEDKRQYTGDIVMNLEGDVILTTQIWAGKTSDCLPHPSVRAKLPHFLFMHSKNHWANLNTKLQQAKAIWDWVVKEHREDAEKDGRNINTAEAEKEAQCVWLLDCW